MEQSATDGFDPVVARRCWSALEIVHVTGYFAPEPRAAYQALGLGARVGYFASRSAPMGPVGPEVTVAAFYVYAPALVASALPAAWDVATPAQVTQARQTGVAQTLHRVLGDPDVGEAVELAHEACRGLAAHGRPLYAGHSSLEWPTEPLMQLWHAATLLREHRGDGHVAALLHSGLDPVEAIITFGQAAGTTDFMKASRGWTEREWAAGEQRLQERGLLADDGSLTRDGVELRTRLEAQTDAAAISGWQRLGAEGTARLLELVVPLRRRLLASDIFPSGLFNRR